jgi:acetyl-CoA hydrolase
MVRFWNKVVPAEKAVQVIKSGDRIFLTGNCSVPQTLLNAVTQRAQAGEVERLEIVQVLTIGDAAYVAPEMEGKIRVNTLFISHNVRKAVNEGRADFTPVFLSEIPRLFRNGHLPLDVALIHCSPPDEHGFLSFWRRSGLDQTGGPECQNRGGGSQRAHAPLPGRQLHPH